MCLCFLSDQNLEFSLLGEHIFLELRGPKITATEVYDVFFSTKNKHEGLKLICLSPHNLHNPDNSLAVRVCGAPGVDREKKVMYERPLGQKGEFDEKTGIFSVEVRAGKPDSPPIAQPFVGKIISPKISIPDGIEQEATRVLFSEVATAFELELGNLEAEQDYMFRLEVTPQSFLGMAPSQKISYEAFNLPPFIVQNLDIFCPKTCHFNAVSLLSDLKEAKKEKLLKLCEPASQFLALINSQDTSVVPINFQRVLLILPENVELEYENCIGCVESLGRYTLKNNRVVLEWIGGTHRYWVDDPFYVAKEIIKVMSDEAFRASYSAESLSTALGVSNDNCLMVVEKLINEGLLQVVDGEKGYFKLAGLSEEERLSKLNNISNNKKLKDAFHWVGYVITYAIKYAYESKIEQKHRVERIQKGERQQTQTKRNYWISIISLGISIFALILALIGILFA